MAEKSKGEKKGKLIPEPGVEYKVLDCSRAGVVSFFGFLDLSAVGPGDTLEIQLLMLLPGAKKPAIVRKRKFSGWVEEPLVEFPSREAINPVVTLKQTLGEPREIRYYFRWEKI